MAFVKDQGLAWIILVGSFFNQMICIGMLLCLGIYFLFIVEHFHCSKREASVVGAMAYGTQCLMGPISSSLYRRFGCRPVIMFGGCLASLGFFMTSWTQTLWHLYATFLLVGVGFGLVYSPSVGILSQYFEKYLYFATSFATVGSAVGTLTFSPFYLHCINQFAWRPSFLINAGVALQIVVFGSLMKSRHSLTSNIKAAADVEGWQKTLEVHLFKNIKFLSLFLDGICFGGSIFVAFGMANQLVVSRGYSKSQSAVLVSIMGLCNVTGRLSSSFIAHLSCTRRVLYFALCGLLCGIFACLASVCQEFWSIALCLGLFGVFFGSKVSQLAAANIELFGAKILVTTIGYSMFSFGIGGFTLPVLAGFVVDRTGSVDNAYILAGSLCLFTFCLLCVFVVRLEKKRPIENAIDSQHPIDNEQLETNELQDVSGR